MLIDGWRSSSLEDLRDFLEPAFFLAAKQIVYSSLHLKSFGKTKFGYSVM